MIQLVSIFLLAVLVELGDFTDAPLSNEMKLVRSSNDLAFGLMNYYKDQKNLFISPFSISTALALVYLGSSGSTTRIMNSALKYDRYGLEESDVHQAFQALLNSYKERVEGYELTSSNNVFVQENFEILPSYSDALKRYYSADIQSVNFQEGEVVKSRINSIVENQTRGKIKDFLKEPPSAAAVLFLLNAVYFLGNWRSPFLPPEFTTKRPFYNNGVDAKQVDTMSKDNRYTFYRSQDLAAEMIELPYQGNNPASMFIVLPDQRTGIEELANSMDQGAFLQLLNTSSSRRVQLLMPKFNLSSSIDLGSALTHLGMGELFDNGADFSRMASGGNLKVSKASHKAVLDVNEKGSEAAAATGIEAVPFSIPPTFAIDHPFLFFIRDGQTGMLLFTGRVDEL